MAYKVLFDFLQLGVSPHLVGRDEVVVADSAARLRPQFFPQSVDFGEGLGHVARVDFRDSVLPGIDLELDPSPLPPFPRFRVRFDHTHCLGSPESGSSPDGRPLRLIGIGLPQRFLISPCRLLLPLPSV